MEIETTNITYQVKKTIRSILIENNIYCYQEIDTIEGNVIRYAEGFTDSRSIQLGKHIEPKKGIYLMSKEVISINISEQSGFYGCRNQEKYIIKNPFTYMETHSNWKEKYIILDYYSYSGNLRYLDGSYYPKSIFFDYIFGELDNYNYYLSEVLEHLKNNEQISFIEEKILDIPIYNCEEGRTKYLAFIYKPTKEEYNDLVKIDDFIMRKNIINKLGLDKFKKKLDEY